MDNSEYSRFWLRSDSQQRNLVVFGYCLSLISKIFPKKVGLEIFGSYNGAKVADNSLALYTARKKEGGRVFFITKNRQELKFIEHVGAKPVWAYSARGIFLQLRASQVFYSHSIFDFISPLTSGANIVALQHGYPVKKGGDVTLDAASRAKLFHPLFGDISSYTYYYFCHVVWTPPGVFEENTRKVFALTSPEIVISNPPRLWEVERLPEERQVLFAPTFMESISIMERLDGWGLLDPGSELCKILIDLDVRLVFRPHPVDLEKLDIDRLPKFFELDTSADSTEAISKSVAVVTDASSLGLDALQLGIPTFFLLPDLEAFEARELGLFENVISTMRERGVESFGAAVTLLFPLKTD